MKFVGLVSGGKDSIYSICKLIDEGHTLVAILNIVSEDKYSDSYMYQTVGSEIASLQGKCLDVPIYIFSSKCKPLCINLEYNSSVGDEVEDIYNGIVEMQKSEKFDAICSGAILSTYQKNRVEDVCKRHNLISLAPLWKKDQKELIVEMIDYGIDARIIKVASSLLDQSCLNMNLKNVNEFIINKKSKYEVNYCGEGGEYETVVLDCPHFKYRIEVGSFDICGHPEENSKQDGVYYLVMKDLKLVNKL